MFPFLTLNSNKSSIKDIPKDFSHSFLFVKNHDFLGTCEFLQNFNIHDHNIWSVKGIADKDVNIRILMFMSVERVFFVVLIFSELIVKSNSKGLIWKLYNFKALFSELVCIVSHLFFRGDDPLIV